MRTIALFHALLCAGLWQSSVHADVDVVGGLKPSFLELKSSVVDTCSTGAICDLICEADFEVYPARQV